MGGVSVGQSSVSDEDDNDDNVLFFVGIKKSPASFGGSEEEDE